MCTVKEEEKTVSRVTDVTQVKTAAVRAGAQGNSRRERHSTKKGRFKLKWPTQYTDAAGASEKGNAKKLTDQVTIHSPFFFFVLFFGT